MLVEFTVGNFKSFKEPVTFSMRAANLTAQNKKLDRNNIFTAKSLNLLKSATIYGANASGKTNLIKAIDFMRWFVLSSSKDTQAKDNIPLEKHLLSTETEKQPSYFEIIFIHKNKRYRYGFEADNQKIHSEWLYHANKRESNLFLRENSQFEVSKVFSEGIGLENKTRPNALFLSVVAQFNGQISENIISWFTELDIVLGINDLAYRDITIEGMLKSESIRERVISLVKSMDTGINHIEITRPEREGMLSQESILAGMKNMFSRIGIDVEKVQFTGKESPPTLINSTHYKYDEKKQIVGTERFDFSTQESDGTQKIFYLSGMLLPLLLTGGVAIIDELDARLHPILTAHIIKLFNSEVTNPNNAQIIFATHNTHLLKNDYFRRDQIWFTEKNKFGATDLYSLVEFNVRNDASFDKNYLLGRYGAIPYIGDITHFFVDGEKNNA